MAIQRNIREQIRSSAGPKSSRIYGTIYQATVTPAMIRKRARELARIRGLPASKTTRADLKEARRELQGAIRAASAAVEAPIPRRQWDPAVGSSGHRTKKIRPQDQRHTKALVEEGVDEAAHHQMIQARKAHR